MRNPAAARLAITAAMTMTLLAAWGAVAGAAQRFSVANGNWSSIAVWSATSGGAPGATAPGAADDATIEGGFTVTLDAAKSATNVTVRAASTLDAATFALTMSATFTLQAGSTFKQGGTVTAVPGVTRSLDNASTYVYYGTQTSITGSGAFGNLTWSSTGNATPGLALTINGNLTLLGSGQLRGSTGSATPTRTHTVAGNVVIDGASAALVGTNATAPGTGTWTIAGNVTTQNGGSLVGCNTGAIADGVFNIAGSLANNGSIAHGAGTGSFAVNLNGTGPQSVSGTGGAIIQNLADQNTAAAATIGLAVTASGTTNLSPGATLVLAAAFTNAGTMTENGTLQFDPGGALITNAPNYGAGSALVFNQAGGHTVGVEWNSSAGAAGTGVPQSVTVQTGAVTLPAAARTVPGNLTFNGGSMSLSGGDLTVDGTLALGGSTITTGGNKVILPGGGSLTRSSGYVAGNLQKQITISGGAGSATFEVGDGASYAPVDFHTSTGATSFNVTASTTAGDQPQLGSSTIDPTKHVKRYWTLSGPPASGVYGSYDATFRFDNPADLDAGANPSNFIVGDYSGGWTYPAVGAKTSTSTQATGLTGFSDFAIGEMICPTITLAPPAGALPGATTGTAYSQTVTASGGTGPYTYAVTLGSLPSGLTLSSGGAISGTPGAAGSSSFTVTATDANGCTGSAAYSIQVTSAGNLVGPAGTTTCITTANPCLTIPMHITRADVVGMRLFHVIFTLSPELKLCGTTGSSILEGDYLSNASPSTTFFVVDNGGGSYTADGTINGTPCGATAASGTLFNLKVTHNGGSGTGTVTVTEVVLRDCSNNTILPTSAGPSASVTIDLAPVSVAAISSPQTVQELSTLTITANATLSSCATGPVTWSVSPSLPAGATFSPGTGVISWTPGCGTAASYGPFTLTATAASGDATASNAFTITVTHKAGTVTVAAVSSPQTVQEQSTLTVTPSAALGACAAGPVSWSVSPALPGGAAFSATTGVIGWTPSCGEAGNYGPFTLTATAAAGETGSSNSFAIVVTHKAGTVTVAAITDPQTVAELATLTITPSAGTSPCVNPASIVWSVTPALPAGASFSTSTGVTTWTPDCAAAEGGVAGTYGPFTLTATAGTGEAGSSDAFSIHVTDTPVAISAPTGAAATQVPTGNPAGDTTGIVVHFTPPSGAASFKVYRAPFGHYPGYDDTGGAPPAQPTTWPPGPPWQLTGVTADGGTDIPPARDYWYYAVYATNACGDISMASTMSGGTLDYHLGDVTDGFVHGLGDNRVGSVDISELGAHYGITLGASDPYAYLDVGPTTTGYVDGRPLTDDQVNFEDLMMFAINYGLVSAPSGPAAAAPAPRAAAADRLVIESPDHVSAGAKLEVPLRLEGTGLVRALSARLKWDASVVEPVGQAAGELLAELGGVALSAQPGAVDAAAFGAGAGLIGTGTLATVRFMAIGSGDPLIRIEGVDARDSHNRAVTVATARDLPASEVPRITALEMAMPNPFRETVTLSVSLAERLPMELGIYSVDGRRVRTLARGEREPGNYRFTWDGRDENGNPMAAGIFYARFTAGRAEFTRRMTYLR